MKHADIQLLLADYRDLRGAERREVEAHVAGCPACAARLAEYQAMDADLQGLRDPWPAPALRNGYRAAVKAGGAQADASRRATAPRPL
jgi:anti-sigma factor RsiW